MVVVGEEHGGGVGVAESVVGGRAVGGVDVVFHFDGNRNEKTMLLSVTEKMLVLLLWLLIRESE